MNKYTKKMSAEGNWYTASVGPWEKHLPGWPAQFGKGSNNTEAVLGVVAQLEDHAGPEAP